MRRRVNVEALRAYSLSTVRARGRHDTNDHHGAASQPASSQPVSQPAAATTPAHRTAAHAIINLILRAFVCKCNSPRHQVESTPRAQRSHSRISHENIIFKFELSARQSATVDSARARRFKNGRGDAVPGKRPVAVA